MVTLVLAVAPRLSVTVAVTVYVPAAVYWCDALEAVVVVPSPKAITALVIEPSGSVEPEEVAVMEPPTRIDREERPSIAMGRWLVAVTLSDLEKLRPELSQPFTTSKCAPSVNVSVVSRLADFAV